MIYTLDVLQGLFERHKLIVATQLCMAILKKNGELQQQKFDFLLRGPKVMGMENPLKEWVLDSTWGSVQALKASELPIMHAAADTTSHSESTLCPKQSLLM